jgi:hypothetical protein
MRAALPLAALAACAATGAEAACRLALVIALDVSASVSVAEYDLQARGMAGALTAPPVVTALLGSQPPVALTVYHWSGPGDQAVVADWTMIDSEAELYEFAATIASYPRRNTFDGRTAIGSSLAFATALLARAPDCRRQVIDIAADGENNASPAPENYRDGAALASVTINALAITGETLIGDDDGWLPRYLEARVIRGPDSFVEIADGYEDFRVAMERKLRRELAEVAVARLNAADPPSSARP